MIKANWVVMHQAIIILPMELTTYLNFTNVFYKYGAYSFIMNQEECEELQNIFKIGFDKGL